MSPIALKPTVEKIKSVFGLNQHQIAKIMGTTVQNLNELLSGATPVPVSLNYPVWWDIAAEVERIKTVDIRVGLKSILVNGKTLLSYLYQGDKDSIIAASREINSRLAALPPRINKTTEQKLTSRLHSIMS
jgi:hypothetical protein